MLEVTEQEVKRDSRAGMPEVGIAIHGRSANIHTYAPLVQGTEILFLTTECVIDLKHNA